MIFYNMPGEKVEIACSGKVTIFYVNFGKLFCRCAARQFVCQCQHEGGGDALCWCLWLFSSRQKIWLSEFLSLTSTHRWSEQSSIRALYSIVAVSGSTVVFMYGAFILSKPPALSRAGAWGEAVWKMSTTCHASHKWLIQCGERHNRFPL